MFIRVAGFLAVLLVTATGVMAQRLSVPSLGGGAADQWKPSAEKTAQDDVSNSNSPAFNPSRADTASSDTGAEGKPVTLVNKGSGVLPNDQGQVWREYDITPAASPVRRNRNRPSSIGFFERRVLKSGSANRWVF